MTTIGSVEALVLATSPSRHTLLVRIESTNGIVGWGESAYAFRERAVAGAVEHLARFLIGREVEDRGALWQEMYRGAYIEGGAVLASAIGAIDIALWDIAGRALGVPIHELLGGRHRDRVEVFATLYGDPIEVLVEQALELSAAGWTTFRLTLPVVAPPDMPHERAFDPKRSLRIHAAAVRAVRSALPPGAILGIDLHHRYSVPETIWFDQAVGPGVLQFLEEPIRRQSPVAYRRLQAQVGTPLAIGEEFASKWEFAPFIDEHLCDLARVDVAGVGGITEAIKVAAMAEARYIECMPHCPGTGVLLAASLQFAAAVPNLFAVEYRVEAEEALYHDLTRGLSRPFEGHLAVLGGPGLGIEVDEPRVRQLASAAGWPEAPHLVRTDGAFTNW
jgi:galactonate dehydratase